MTFVTTGLAVAGLAATAIPIVIFLLWRQRRTPVEWGAMRFLLQAFRRQRRRLRLEQILLLLVRCLIVALFGAALARPLMERAGILDRGGARTVYLVVDDGLVSGAQGADGGTALAGHVARAKAILETLGPADRVGLITAARPARTVLSPPSTDHAAVIQLLEAMRPAGAPTDLPGALERLRAVVDELEPDHDQVFAYLLSDFRAGSVALEAAPPATGVDEDRAGRIVLLAAPPATETIANVQITAVEPARAILLAGAVDGSDQVTVRLARQGGGLAREVSRVRIEGEGLAPVAPRVVEWAPGQPETSVDFVLAFEPGRERAAGVTVSIEPDALPADDERHAVLTLRDEIRVVLVDRRTFGLDPGLDRLGAGQWIRRALAPGDQGPIEVVGIEPALLDERDLRIADAVMLPRPDLLTDDGWTLLRTFVDAGGLVLVMPPPEVNVHRWTDRLEASLGLPWALEREVRTLDAPMPLADEQPASALLRMIASDLSAVGRPVDVRRMLPVQDGQTRAEVILRLADGSPLLIAGTPDAARGAADRSAASLGLVVYLAVAPQLDWTTLPTKPLMVPLLQEILRQGLSIVRSGGAIGVGARPPLIVGPAARGLETADGTRLAIDAARRPATPFPRAGRYRVVDGAGQAVGAIAVNVDAAAARTDPQPESAVTAWLSRSGPWTLLDADDPGSALRRVTGGSPLAGPLLLVVLVLLVVETLLARWFSHAGVAGPSGRGRGLRPTMTEHAETGPGGTGLGGAAAHAGGAA